MVHWVAFDGVDDVIRSNDFGLAQPYTVSIAFYPTAADDFFFDGLSINSGSLYILADGSDRLRAFAGSTLASSQAVKLNEWNIATVIFDGANSEIQLNESSNTGNAGSGAPGGVTLGVGGDASTRPYAGRIAGVLVSEGRRSVDEIDRSQSYLNSLVGGAAI